MGAGTPLWKIARVLLVSLLLLSYMYFLHLHRQSSLSFCLQHNMDISEPTADTREKVSTALNLFRQRVLEHNRIEARFFIKYFDDIDGAIGPGDEEAREERILDILS